LTLAELSRQFSAVKESVRNVNFQFLEATRTTNMSNMLLAFDFFCRLGARPVALWPISPFTLAPEF
jgi:hypothetical protein